MYRVTVHTDEQLMLIQKMSECYMRERMGQFWDLAEDLASEGAGYDPDPDLPGHEDAASEYMERRENAEAMFNKAFHASGASSARGEMANRAGDFYTTVRYAMWLDRPEPKPHGTVDSHPCYHWGKEHEPPKCYRLATSEDAKGAWILEMDRGQLVFLQAMSETFMRERAGQFWLLVDSLSYDGLDFENKTEDFKARFAKCTKNAAKAKDLFDAGYRASGAADCPRKTRRMMMAYDIYSTIRHALWLEDPVPGDHLASGRPIHECRDVPLIEIGH